MFALGKSLPFSAAVLVRKDLPGQAAGGGGRAGPGCWASLQCCVPSFPESTSCPIPGGEQLVRGPGRVPPSGEKLISWSLISGQRSIWSRWPEPERVEVRGWDSLVGNEWPVWGDNQRQGSVGREACGVRSCLLGKELRASGENLNFYF